MIEGRPFVQAITARIGQGATPPSTAPGPAAACANPARDPPTDPRRCPGAGQSVAGLAGAGAVVGGIPRHRRSGLFAPACRGLHRASGRQRQRGRRGYPAVPRPARRGRSTAGRRRAATEPAWRGDAGWRRGSRAARPAPLRSRRAGDPHLSPGDLGAPAAPGPQGIWRARPDPRPSRCARRSPTTSTWSVAHAPRPTGYWC